MMSSNLSVVPSSRIPRNFVGWRDSLLAAVGSIFAPRSHDPTGGSGTPHIG